jgi:hypothetical protein
MNRKDFEIWASTIKLIMMASESQISSLETLAMRIGLVEKQLSLWFQLDSVPDSDDKREQLSKIAIQAAALSNDKSLGDHLARLQSAHDQLAALIENIRASFGPTAPSGE